MYNTHPEFHSRGDDPSASVHLAACLDHSAWQQYRLNSGLFMLSTWHWRTPSASCVRGFSYYNKKIPAFIFFVAVFPVYFLPSGCQ